jgi:hypothetical protein
MNKIKLIVTSIALLSTAMTCQQAAAAEIYKHITTSNPTPLQIISDSNEATLGDGHSRVVHSVIATNDKTIPVKITLTKIEATATGETFVTKNVTIVAANSTHEISFPSGLYLLKTSATVFDDLQVEIAPTITSSASSAAPEVDFTFDFADN